MCRANNLTAERRAAGPTARRYDRPRAAAAGLVGTPILIARAAVLGPPLPRNRHLGREQFKKRGDYEPSHVGTKGARQQRAAKQHQVELLAELKAEAIAEQSGAPGPITMPRKVAEMSSHSMTASIPPAAPWRPERRSRDRDRRNRRTCRRRSAPARASETAKCSAGRAVSRCRLPIRHNVSPLYFAFSKGVTLRHYVFLERIFTPAHPSRTRATDVKSLSDPKVALVTAISCLTAAPTTMGTPMASASSTQRRTSL